VWAGYFMTTSMTGGFEQSFAFMRSVGDGFLEAYVPILQRRKEMPWTEPERQWQLYRRGRYVEFNLVHDRGTLFGLQTNGRTEAILMSLPPLVRWEYGYTPVARDAGSDAHDGLFKTAGLAGARACCEHVMMRPSWQTVHFAGGFADLIR